MSTMALDVYDWLHFFGCSRVTFDEWRHTFRRGRSRETARRSWERLPSRLRAHGIPFERGPEGMRLLPDARTWCESEAA